jgi:hypothetical protein
MSFYQVHVNGSAVLGTGDLNGSVATFGGAGVGTGTSPVPLPTPLLLLLSGLGLMGVVARRGKPSADLASGRSGGPTSGESAYGQITPGLDTQEIVTETPSFNAAAR